MLTLMKQFGAGDKLNNKQSLQNVKCRVFLASETENLFLNSVLSFVSVE